MDNKNNYRNSDDTIVKTDEEWEIIVPAGDYMWEKFDNGETQTTNKDSKLSILTKLNKYEKESKGTQSNLRKFIPWIIGIGLIVIVSILFFVLGFGKSKLYLTQEYIEQGEMFDPLKIVALVEGENGKYQISVKENNVDVKKEGEYEIIYTLTSKKTGKKEDNKQAIIVKDTLGPKIECKDLVKVTYGKKFDISKHVKLIDVGDGKININKLKVDGKVNVKKADKYKLTLTAQDSKGNTSAKEIIVQVKKEKPKYNAAYFYKKINGIWINASGNVYAFTTNKGRYIFNFSFGFDQGADEGTLSFIKVTKNTATVNWHYKAEGESDASITSFFIDLGVDRDGIMEVNGTTVKYAGSTYKEAKKNMRKLF